mmetsp:Transcript_15637/g.35023  ORF Transcript_15637/g.35023 Transcript_15637/m.35023 type:complete len:251 (-) Transcript_15637:40-792(-)
MPCQPPTLAASDASGWNLRRSDDLCSAGVFAAARPSRPEGRRALRDPDRQGAASVPALARLRCGTSGRHVGLSLHQGCPAVHASARLRPAVIDGVWGMKSTKALQALLNAPPPSLQLVATAIPVVPVASRRVTSCRLARFADSLRRALLSAARARCYCCWVIFYARVRVSARVCIAIMLPRLCAGRRMDTRWYPVLHTCRILRFCKYCTHRVLQLFAILWNRIWNVCLSVIFAVILLEPTTRRGYLNINE